MPGTAQGQAGTSRDKAGIMQGQTGTSRDKKEQTGAFPFCPCLSLLFSVCPCLSMLVPACPCLSLSVPVCTCLSLSVSTFAIPSCLPLQMNTTVFISMILVTLTFLPKATVQMHANIDFNLFFTFHLAGSIYLSFNPKSSILVINITKGSTWFLSSFVLSV